MTALGQGLTGTGRGWLCCCGGTGGGVVDAADGRVAEAMARENFGMGAVEAARWHAGSG